MPAGFPGSHSFNSPGRKGLEMCHFRVESSEFCELITKTVQLRELGWLVVFLPVRKQHFEILKSYFYSCKAEPDAFLAGIQRKVLSFHWNSL